MNLVETGISFLRKENSLRKLHLISHFGGKTFFTDEVIARCNSFSKTNSLDSFIEEIKVNGGAHYIEAQINIFRDSSSQKKNNGVVLPDYFDYFNHEIRIRAIANSNTIIDFPHQIGSLLCDTDNGSVYANNPNVMKTYLTGGLELAKIIKKFPGAKSHLLDNNKLSKERYLNIAKSALSSKLQPWVSPEGLH